MPQSLALDAAQGAALQVTAGAADAAVDVADVCDLQCTPTCSLMPASSSLIQRCKPLRLTAPPPQQVPPALPDSPGCQGPRLHNVWVDAQHSAADGGHVHTIEVCDTARVQRHHRSVAALQPPWLQHKQEGVGAVTSSSPLMCCVLDAPCQPIPVITTPADLQQIYTLPCIPSVLGFSLLGSAPPTDRLGHVRGCPTALTPRCRCDHAAWQCACVSHLRHAW